MHYIIFLENLVPWRIMFMIHYRAKRHLSTKAPVTMYWTNWVLTFKMRWKKPSSETVLRWSAIWLYEVSLASWSSVRTFLSRFWSLSGIKTIMTSFNIPTYYYWTCLEHFQLEVSVFLVDLSITINKYKVWIFFLISFMNPCIALVWRKLNHFCSFHSHSWGFQLHL